MAEAPAKHNRGRIDPSAFARVHRAPQPGANALAHALYPAMTCGQIYWIR